MKIVKISKKDIVPAVWDGGKTFEYYIFPKEASYVNKDFLFRISAASIEKTPSVFTQFKNYQRFLIMLDSNLQLNINEKNASFDKHEVFEFNSDNHIVSSSSGNDFNLMVAEDKAKAFVEITSQNIKSKYRCIAFFALEKSFLKIGTTIYELSENDLLLIENNELKEIEIETQFKAVFIQIDF